MFHQSKSGIGIGIRQVRCKDNVTCFPSTPSYVKRDSTKTNQQPASPTSSHFVTFIPVEQRFIQLSMLKYRVAAGEGFKRPARRRGGFAGRKPIDRLLGFGHKRTPRLKHDLSSEPTKRPLRRLIRVRSPRQKQTFGRHETLCPDESNSQVIMLAEVVWNV